MFDLFTSLAQTQGVNETVGFFTVMFSGATLMPIAFVLLSGVFTSESKWETPPEAYVPRNKRDLI